MLRDCLGKVTGLIENGAITIITKKVSFTNTVSLQELYLRKLLTDTWRRRQWQPTPVLLPGKSHGWRGLQSLGSQRVGHTERLHFLSFYSSFWRRKWQPSPVFLPGQSHARGAQWATVYGVAKSRTRLSN